jgi:periplasmic protein TonB
MHSLQETQAPEIKSAFHADFVQKQRQQMFIALTLLLTALIVILAKDREFWFPSSPVAQSVSEPVEQVSPEITPQSETTKTPIHPAGPASPKVRPQRPPATVAAKEAGASAPVVTSRTVLPPLAVDVVAGDEHHAVQGASNSVKVDMGAGTSGTSPATSATTTTASNAVVNATTRVHMSPGAAQMVSHPVEPTYPLLAKEMKIQGAVAMQVLIGRDGIIQHLNVLSGPAILSTAAREAVKQWRFKPYLQSGQAVETEARIVVNFTIWTQ